MYDEIKKMPIRVRWQIRNVYKITQYKDGCVYRTRSLGYIVCEPLYQLLNMKDIQFGSISTKMLKEIG